MGRINNLIKRFLEHGYKKVHYLLGLSTVAFACHNPKPPVFIFAQEKDIKLEVDSVLGGPEIAIFPIRIRLTNNTDKKVALLFDTISDGYGPRVKNMYLTNGKDTFSIVVRSSGMPLVFNERTVNSFNCEGYFMYGPGHFDSYWEIDSVFKSAKLVYKHNDKLIQQALAEGVLTEADTFLIPTILEANTENALLVDEFLQQSYGPIREVNLKKREIRHTTTPKR